mmetsp:Transcript_98185/g.311456  ORF Transcript_98185/g.311456 Transcript_98185/m.311456 type:complete len:248 (-) Transcript_98185:679-1422(-)
MLGDLPPRPALGGRMPGSGMHVRGAGPPLAHDRSVASPGLPAGGASARRGRDPCGRCRGGLSATGPPAARGVGRRSRPGARRRAVYRGVPPGRRGPALRRHRLRQRCRRLRRSFGLPTRGEQPTGGGRLGLPGLRGEGRTAAGRTHGRGQGLQGRPSDAAQRGLRRGRAVIRRAALPAGAAAALPARLRPTRHQRRGERRLRPAGGGGRIHRTAEASRQAVLGARPAPVRRRLRRWGLVPPLPLPGR